MAIIINDKTYRNLPEQVKENASNIEELETRVSDLEDAQITIDDALSSTSENPVQNKVVYNNISALSTIMTRKADIISDNTFRGDNTFAGTTTYTGTVDFTDATLVGISFDNMMTTNTAQGVSAPKTFSGTNMLRVSNTGWNTKWAFNFNASNLDLNYLNNSDTSTTHYKFSSSAFTPATSLGKSLGTSSVKWGDAYIGGTLYVDRNNGISDGTYSIAVADAWALGQIARYSFQNSTVSHGSYLDPSTDALTILLVGQHTDIVLNGMVYRYIATDTSGTNHYSATVYDENTNTYATQYAFIESTYRVGFITPSVGGGVYRHTIKITDSDDNDYTLVIVNGSSTQINSFSAFAQATRIGTFGVSNYLHEIFNGYRNGDRNFISVSNDETKLQVGNAMNSIVNINFSIEDVVDTVS